jgi:hypothetical protein
MDVMRLEEILPMAFIYIEFKRKWTGLFLHPLGELQNFDKDKN